MKKYILFSLLVITAAACKKKPTTWHSDWAVPLVSDTLTLANLLNDSTLIESPSGFYELDLTRTLLSFDVNELVEIPDTTIHEEFVSSFLNFPVNAGDPFVSSIEEHDLNLEGLELKKIILKSGFIDVKVSNPVATNAFFDVLLPGVSKDGVQFLEQYMAPPGTNANPGVVERTIDLSGYTIDLKGPNGASYNKLLSQITAFTDPNGPDINLTNQDVTSIDATFRDVRLDYAQGYFGNQVVSDTSILELDLLDAYQSGVLDISNMTIQFEVENGIKVGAQGKILFVENENINGQIVSLNGSNIGNSFNIDPATGVWSGLSPALSNIEFSSANSNIEAYLENLGKTHRIAYTLQLNPWGNISGGWDEIFPQSQIEIKLKAQMPMTIGMEDLILREEFDVDLVQNTNETRIVSGEFILNTQNAFPFSADVTMFLLGASDNVFVHKVSPY